MSVDRLSADEDRLWRALKAVSTQTQKLLGGDLAPGISGADFGILSRLQDLGQGRLPQAALLASLGWDKSRLSHQLTRMEARGLLSRERPAGEPVAVALSPVGAEMLATIRPLHAEAVRRHLAAFTPAEAQLMLGLAAKFSDG